MNQLPISSPACKKLHPNKGKAHLAEKPTILLRSLGEARSQGKLLLQNLERATGDHGKSQLNE